MIGFSTAIRTARAQAILNAIEADTGAGTIVFYKGTRPATGGAANSSDILGTCTMSDPAGSVANGVLTFGAITPDIGADQTGTVTWARMLGGQGTFIADFSVGTSGTDIIVNTTSFIAGGPISISSATITEGNA